MLVQLRGRITNVETRAGGVVTDRDCPVLLQGDADVYKPNGDPLVLLRRGAIPVDILDRALPSLRFVAQKYKSDNRGKYAGAKRATSLFQDGTKSKNTRTVDENGKTLAVESAVAGYFDRQGGRFPFCRATAFTAEEVAKWNDVVPMAQFVAELFKKTLPQRHGVQQAIADATPSEYIISGTPYTTLTINRNICGRIHKDAGDFKAGFGCLSVCRTGKYQGGTLVFPEYGVGADLQHGDVIFFNPHEWHGVVDFHDTEEGFERISVVYYYRERMKDCLPAEQELARAKARGGL